MACGFWEGGCLVSIYHHVGLLWCIGLEGFTDVDASVVLLKTNATATSMDVASVTQRIKFSMFPDRYPAFMVCIPGI